ncbi:hypothetical protein NDU88_004319 [Pleurodeles waltl]|uniref:Uncharacterized protein n=1 Tax=Pleurodeles waltl TaxID=8319 RepID=A0AAV7W4M5_PLEWA|nr:hypothetical protein NDU88_004319 [Pleurodeles waltl]
MWPPTRVRSWRLTFPGDLRLWSRARLRPPRISLAVHRAGSILGRGQYGGVSGCGIRSSAARAFSVTGRPPAPTGGTALAPWGHREAPRAEFGARPAALIGDAAARDAEQEASAAANWDPEGVSGSGRAAEVWSLGTWPHMEASCMWCGWHHRDRVPLRGPTGSEAR